MLKNIILVGLGGGIGAMLRYGITLLFSALHWSTNVGTFLTNILGSLAMGILTGCTRNEQLLLLLTVGVCGGFTTFSTFSTQSMGLLQSGRYLPAFAYIIGTVTVCILFAFIGYYIGTRLGGR